MQYGEAKQVAERLLRPVFRNRPFEEPLRAAQREVAQQKIQELQSGPAGAGLSSDQAAQRADLEEWLKRCRAEAAVLKQAGLRVYYRSKKQREPWRVGVFLNFDSQGLRLRLRPQSKEKTEVKDQIVVLDPQKFQIATDLEREQLRLRAQIRAAERQLAALRKTQRYLDRRLARLQTPVTTVLASSPKPSQSVSQPVAATQVQVAEGAS